jgi:predicted house-cleaning noncanonical NTP pyrophosphatase (MazG superfamily)
VRCKTNIIDFSSRGNFIAREAGRPWDWKQSLTGEQLALVRDYSTALSTHLQRPVETMFFVGVPRHLAQSAVLPWFYTTEITMSEPLTRTESHFAAAQFVVRNSHDVEAFRTTAGENPVWAQRVALRLDPDMGALRDDAFLDEVASAAADTGCHVEFDGSLLSHAYATLQRQGVHVRATESGSGERLRFNKLVRDLVPSQIESRGERVTSVRLSARQVERLLLQKLVEEVVEVRLTDSRESRLEELADVAEVVFALARDAGATLEDVLGIVEDKRRRRGGFEQGVLLVDTYLPSAAEAAGKTGWQDSGERKRRAAGRSCRRRYLRRRG